MSDLVERFWNFPIHLEMHHYQAPQGTTVDLRIILCRQSQVDKAIEALRVVRSLLPDDDAALAGEGET